MPPPMIIQQSLGMIIFFNTQKAVFRRAPVIFRQQIWLNASLI